MNASQRKTYFGILWPAACKAQGWLVKDDDRRREVTMQATGKDSTSSLTEAQITLLFNRLKQLADPADFDLAYADANPEIALEEHKRGQIIWRIENSTAKAGLTEAWLVEISAAKCATHDVKHWRQLPTVELVKLSMTVESRTSDAAQARRAQKNPPRAAALQDTCIEGVVMPF